jgi:hypothetical protein
MVEYAVLLVLMGVVVMMLDGPREPGPNISGGLGPVRHGSG